MKITDLEKSLGGYEAAVKFLRTENWPPGPQENVLLGVCYAAALADCLKNYGDEIRQREKTVSSDVIDLKAWKQMQIAEEIRETYQNILPQGEGLGAATPAFFARHITEGNYPVGVRPILRKPSLRLQIRSGHRHL